MKDIHSPRHYLLEILLPAYEDFGKILVDGVAGGRRDVNALGKVAEACLHLADHIASDDLYKDVIPGAPESKEYVKELTEKYSTFAITRDIANSFKHRQISRKHRQIDGLKSLKERWALVRYTDAEGHYFATRKVVTVSLKHGREVFAEDVIGDCIARWAEELMRLKIISEPPAIQFPERFIERDKAPQPPSIVLRLEQGEYAAFESPLMLSYDKDKDTFQPMRDKIGSLAVRVECVVSPSRFDEVKRQTQGK